MSRRLGSVACLLLALALSSACASPPPKGRYGKPSEPGSQVIDVDAAALEWRKARVTNFESYPDPGSEECIKFSGCEYSGEFAALPGKQSETWVKTHNIAAVHLDDFPTYKLKTLRLRDDAGNTIDAVVYDACSDSDCDGCCTRNKSGTGFLIDLEINTEIRFGSEADVVDWACLDC
jgi:hypothetical protein